MNNTKIASVSTAIDGAVRNDNICDMWQDHFKEILNSSKDNSMKQFVLDSLHSLKETVNMFSNIDIKDAIRALNAGKSAGMDGLDSKNFKVTDDRLCVLFRLLFMFNSVTVHGYVPSHLMDSIIIPVLKDSKGDIIDKDNYRPVAITCISSKLIELLILHRYEYCFKTTDHQFSYMSHYSTDMCVFVLKETVDYYMFSMSPVYKCYVDASKAFDHVNYWNLFNKLLSRGLPHIIVRLFVYWFTSQTFVVK